MNLNDVCEWRAGVVLAVAACFGCGDDPRVPVDSSSAGSSTMTASGGGSDAADGSDGTDGADGVDSSGGQDGSGGGGSTSETAGATTGTAGPPAQELFECNLEQPCGSGDYDGYCNDVPGDCPEPPVWSAVDVCRLELAMDAASGGVTAEMNADYGGEPSWSYVYETTVLHSDQTALLQRHVEDTKFGGSITTEVRRCDLQPPEYFQACLDDPQWECAFEDNWFVNCVEVNAFECEG